jgi:glucosamine-6-phosphate deaminase
MTPLSWHVDGLRVVRHVDRRALGKAAGEEIADWIRTRLASHPRVRVVFAAAPSQNEMLDTLAESIGIDWPRVEAFHMDEYVGLPAAAPQRFGRYLEERLFSRVRPGVVQLIDGRADPEAECRRYAALLAAAPLDLVCLGVGENGHLAFNDPPVADFADLLPMKRVTLDPECRRQQVNDGCFAALADVPRTALTLTIPTLLSAARLVAAVPGPTKRPAVQRLLSGPVSPACPATALRHHRATTLHVDADSCPATEPPS